MGYSYHGLQNWKCWNLSPLTWPSHWFPLPFPSQTPLLRLTVWCCWAAHAGDRQKLGKATLRVRLADRRCDQDSDWLSLPTGLLFLGRMSHSLDTLAGDVWIWARHNELKPATLLSCYKRYKFQEPHSGGEEAKSRNNQQRFWTHPCEWTQAPPLQKLPWEQCPGVDSSPTSGMPLSLWVAKHSWAMYILYTGNRNPQSRPLAPDK